MLARTLLLFAIILGTCHSHLYAQPWAEKMFDSLEYDFGDLARGAKAEHRFTIENLYQEDLKITAVKSSCGCTAPRLDKDVIRSGETAELITAFNTVAFQGRHTATITVVFAPPYTAEVRLSVVGFVRRDVVFQPGRIEFGSVPQSETVEKVVRVKYAGREDWKITDVRSGNQSVEVELKEVARGKGRVEYDMLFRLKPDAPAGYINDRLTLVTNDADHRLIPLAVEGNIMAALSVSPTSLHLGKLQPGQTVTKRLVVRGSSPFRIVKLDCEGGDDCFEFFPSTAQRQVHLIPVKFTAPNQPGTVNEKIRIVTDGDDAVAPTVTAQAEVVSP